VRLDGDFWPKGTEIKTKAVDVKNKWDHLIGYEKKHEGKVVFKKPKRPEARDLAVMTPTEARSLWGRYRSRLSDWRDNRSKVAEWSRNGKIPLDDIQWKTNGVDPASLPKSLRDASVQGSPPSGSTATA
jgi:hypothetical protein